MDIVYCQDYEELDEEKAIRSIVVSNIPPEFGGEKVYIHFQRKKNGGGEIERLCIVEQEGTAVITYEEADVARRVLGRAQICEKSEEKFKVQRFEVVRPPEPPEVFHRVSARLNWEIFRSNGVLDSQKLLRRVAAETEVDWHEACDGYIISGTFEQLQNANRELNMLLRRTALQNPELRLHLSSKGGDVATNSGTENSRDSLERNKQREDKEEVLEEFPPFDVEPRFMTYLHAKHCETLNELQKTFSVHFEWPLNGENTKASIKAIAGCKKREYNDALEKFFEFFKTLFSKVKQEVVFQRTYGPEVKQVLDLVDSDVFEAIVLKEDDKMLVYGVKNSVDLVVKIIKNMLGEGQDISQRRTPVDGLVDEGSDERKQKSIPQTFSQGYPSRLEQVLKNGVRLSVYQDDITNLRVDVIVNAANGRLVHDGGLAKAIQKKGGDQISAESRFIIHSRQGWPLSVGETVYTHGGNLPCSLVIHAVGPVWGKQSHQHSVLLLHKTVISSLRLAASLNCRSIALPAISSGTHGMPKEESARAMFDAVEEYSQSIEARQSPLCDISFVNIDLPTVNAFMQEFVKRFKEGTPVASIKVKGTSSGFESLPTHDQETFSSMPTGSMAPLENQRYKHQLKGTQISSPNGNKHATTPPFSSPDNTTHSPGFSSLQSDQISASLPPYIEKESHKAKPADQGKGISYRIHDPEMFPSMPTNYITAQFENQRHKLQLQGAQISNQNDSKQASTPPFSSVPDNTTHSPSLPPQSVQMSASLPPYNAAESHTAKSVDQHKGIGGINTSSDGIKDIKETTQSFSSSAAGKEDKNQPELDRTDPSTGIRSVKGKGRGRGFLTAQIGLPSTPGKSVGASKGAYGRGHVLNSQNVHREDVKPPASNSLGTNVETTSASSPPPEMRKNSLPKVKKNEDTRNESCSVHGESLDLNAGITVTSEAKETERESEMNIPEQTQTSIDQPKTEQKHNEHSSETENEDNKTKEENTSPKDGTQKTPAGCDFKEPSVEKSSSKTDQNVLLKIDNEVTANKTLKDPSKSSLLSRQSEAVESSSKQMTVFGGNPDLVQEHEELRHEITFRVEQKEQLKEESVAEIKNHQLSETGHPTKAHSNISPKSEEDTDSFKDSAHDDNVTVSHNEGAFNHFSKGNVNSSENSKKDVLQRSKDEEKMEEVKRNNETTSNVTNNSPKEARSLSDSKGQEESMIDSEKDEEKQMPPLLDCSEEDNNVVVKTQLDSHEADSTGDQPFGCMKYENDVRHLPGYPKYGTIAIKYSFSEGTQGPEHPNPGHPYLAYDYEAFLPDSPQGREVLKLLKTAFEKKQLFTLKGSNINGEPARIVLGDIPHKTSRTGGLSENGYPDPKYLEEVKAKLVEHGYSSPS